MIIFLLNQFWSLMSYTCRVEVVRVGQESQQCFSTSGQPPIMYLWVLVHVPLEKLHAKYGTSLVLFGGAIREKPHFGPNQFLVCKKWLCRIFQLWNCAYFSMFVNTFHFLSPSSDKKRHLFQIVFEQVFGAIQSNLWVQHDNCAGRDKWAAHSFQWKTAK